MMDEVGLLRHLTKLDHIGNLALVSGQDTLALNAAKKPAQVLPLNICAVFNTPLSD
jgi:hypothetical protein